MLGRTLAQHSPLYAPEPHMPAPAFPHSPTATISRWSDRPTDRPLSLLERQRIIGAHAMISRVLLRKGCIVASHAHANEQFGIVLSGRIKFGLGAPNSPDHCHKTLGPDEIIHLPSHFPHSAEALEDTLILDIFSPPSDKTGIDTRPS